MKSPKTLSLFPFSHPFLALFVAAIGTLVLAGNAFAVPPTSYSTDFDSMNTGSIFGQEGWVNLGGANYVQSVTNTADTMNATTAHSGDQSWLLSNAVNNGSVRTIGTPTFAQVGESNTVFGGTPAYNQFTESFWFRTVSTTSDPGLYVSQSLGTAASVRNTYVRVSETAGVLSFDAIGGPWVTNPDPNLSDFSQDPTVVGLAWGAWYQVRETATFIDGPDNDTVRYQLFNASGTSLMDSTIGSWEGYYMDAAQSPEQYPGPVASNQVSWGLAQAAGVQGLYIDDLSLSVQAIPEPSTWAAGTLIASALGFSALRRRKVQS